MPVTQSTPTLQQSQTGNISQDATSTDKQDKAPVDNTQPLSKTTTPQTVIDRPQTTPMPTRVASPPTRTPLAPIVTQFQPMSQQPATLLPSRIKNVQTVVPSNQWRASPTLSAIAKPTQVISNSTAIPSNPPERRSRSGRTIKSREIMTYDKLGGVAELLKQQQK